MKKRKDSNETKGIQINKYISNTGFCSRREAEKLIEQARVTINDELCLLSARVNIGDIVEVHGVFEVTRYRGEGKGCCREAGAGQEAC